MSARLGAALAHARGGRGGGARTRAECPRPLEHERIQCFLAGTGVVEEGSSCGDGVTWRCIFPSARYLAGRGGARTSEAAEEDCPASGLGPRDPERFSGRSGRWGGGARRTPGVGRWRLGARWNARSCFRPGPRQSGGWVCGAGMAGREDGLPASRMNELRAGGERKGRDLPAASRSPGGGSRFGALSLGPVTFCDRSTPVLGGV